LAVLELLHDFISVEQEVVMNEAYSISLIDGLTNAGFSIPELEGMYKPCADKKERIGTS
jgi:hypothetical protein